MKPGMSIVYSSGQESPALTGDPETDEAFCAGRAAPVHRVAPRDLISAMLEAGRATLRPERCWNVAMPTRRP
jgi:hypothetical protein